MTSWRPLCAVFAAIAMVTVIESAAAASDEWRSGLSAESHSLGEPAAKLSRIEVKPAFSLGHSSPHPRLPPGPFEVVWTGVLIVAEGGPLQFDAAICGELKVTIDGVAVLSGRAE